MGGGDIFSGCWVVGLVVPGGVLTWFGPGGVRVADVGDAVRFGSVGEAEVFRGEVLAFRRFLPVWVSVEVLACG